MTMIDDKYDDLFLICLLDLLASAQGRLGVLSSGPNNGAVGEILDEATGVPGIYIRKCNNFRFVFVVEAQMAPECRSRGLLAFWCCPKLWTRDDE